MWWEMLYPLYFVYFFQKILPNKKKFTDITFFIISVSFPQVDGRREVRGQKIWERKRDLSVCVRERESRDVSFFEFEYEFKFLWESVR